MLGDGSFERPPLGSRRRELWGAQRLHPCGFGGDRGAGVCQAAILASSKSTTPLPLEHNRNPRSANEGAAHIATMTQLPVQTIHRDPQLLYAPPLPRDG